MEDTKTMMQVTASEKWWRKIGNFIYDYSGPCINAVDVATDILVTREFFMEGRMLFFWISFVILSVAQIFYAGLFVTIYADHLPKKKQMVVFMCVFPFGQLVPLFIWIEAFEFRWLTAILQFLGFHTHASTERVKPPDMDDLQWWIQERIRSQGGFIIESFMEAFPESIMQMIAILIRQEAKPLNVFSILFSMTSVGSKALMFSYSIDRATFLFNFLCFAADIFGIFSTVSWVFFDPAKETFHLTALGSAWVWKVGIFSVIFLAATLIIVITLGLVKLLEYCRRDRANSNGGIQCDAFLRACRHHIASCFAGTRGCCITFLDLTVRQICGFLGQVCSFLFYGTFAIAYALLIPVGVVFSFGVVVMLLEIGKFSFIPILFQQLDPGHQNNAKLYRPLFRWLTWAPTAIDYHLRLAVTNHVAVKHFLINNFGLNYEDVRLWFDYPQMKFCVWLLQLKPDPIKELALQQRQNANGNANNNHIQLQPQPEEKGWGKDEEEDDAVITFTDTEMVPVNSDKAQDNDENVDNNANTQENGDHEANKPSQIDEQFADDTQTAQKNVALEANTENQLVVANGDANTNVLEDPIKIGFMHVLAMRPKDLRHYGKASLNHYIHEYFGFMRKLYEEDIYREWYNVNCCGKFILCIAMVVIFLCIYLLIPCLVIYIVVSFAYPIICMMATPWPKVELLQQVLTFGYIGMCTLLIILAPRVHRFQHANYHMLAARRSFFDLRGEEGMAEIRKEYVNVMAAYQRNQVIKEFFGKLTPSVLQFLPEIEELEDELEINNSKLYLRHTPNLDHELFDAREVRTHEKLLKDLDILEQHAEYLRTSALKPPDRIFNKKSAPASQP